MVELFKGWLGLVFVFVCCQPTDLILGFFGFIYIFQFYSPPPPKVQTATLANVNITTLESTTVFADTVSAGYIKVRGSKMKQYQYHSNMQKCEKKKG